ncbi:MAG: hypothetical protein ACE5H9_17760, partial [Anaerolineae bacterium]
MAVLQSPNSNLPLLFIVLLRLALLLAYTGLIPLGEAPDEPAHLDYARFIAQHGRLPADLAERDAAGYRSVWPPLYHLLVSLPLAVVGDAPPTQLKAVGDTPRRLIPTDGQTIAAFIHTGDEAWPWRGLPLAWHLGRLVSVGLATGAVLITYAFARRVTASRRLALGAAALHAFVPQTLFIGAVLNDDNLLFVLSGLVLLALIAIAQRAGPPAPAQVFRLGILLGLATVAKYNALPLWILVLLWGGWLARKTWLKSGLALFSGAFMGAGWWFGFVWLQFNQIERLGWLRGSLAALTAGTADASLRRLSAGADLRLPPPSAWLEWSSTFFRSFWGLFGGGGTIALPGWGYLLLAALSVLAIGGLFARRAGEQSAGNITPFLLATPFLFLLLPLARFILTGGSVAETAQARHLFPALPVIALGFVWGLAGIGRGAGKRLRTLSSARFNFGFEIILPLVGLLLSLSALPLIEAAYPPPIPLRTTPEAATAQNLVNAPLAEGITLIGYELEPVAEGRLPVTLVWGATGIPPENYRVQLSLTDAEGHSPGGWIGHPLGGRYPTRAWDAGDVLRHTVPIPVVPGLPATQATLSLRLLDGEGRPATDAIALTGLAIPASPAAPLTPAQLRADGLAPESAFTYRSTLSFVLPDQSAPPRLVAPDGATYAPLQFLRGDKGGVAHFLVDAAWPAGTYRLSADERLTALVANRARRFDGPAPAFVVNAGFAGEVTLLGYDLPQRRVRPGESFPVVLYWRAEKTIDRDLTVFNHLLDQASVQRGGADRIPQNYYSTVLWAPGEIVSDRYEVPVEAAAPDGIYWLDVGLYPSEQPGFSLPRFAEGLPVESNSVRLGPVKVGGPPAGATIGEADPQTPLRQSFG